MTIVSPEKEDLRPKTADVEPGMRRDTYASGMPTPVLEISSESDDNDESKRITSKSISKHSKRKQKLLSGSTNEDRDNPGCSIDIDGSEAS